MSKENFGVYQIFLFHFCVLESMWFFIYFFKAGTVILCFVILAGITWSATKWWYGSLVQQDKSVEKANPGRESWIHSCKFVISFLERVQLSVVCLFAGKLFVVFLWLIAETVSIVTFSVCLDWPWQCVSMCHRDYDKNYTLGLQRNQDATIFLSNSSWFQTFNYYSLQTSFCRNTGSIARVWVCLFCFLIFLKKSIFL